MHTQIAVWQDGIKSYAQVQGRQPARYGDLTAFELANAYMPDDPESPCDGPHIGPLPEWCAAPRLSLGYVITLPNTD